MPRAQREAGSGRRPRRPSNQHPRCPGHRHPRHPGNQHPRCPSRRHPRRPGNQHPRRPGSRHPRCPSHRHPRCPSNQYPRCHRSRHPPPSHRCCPSCAERGGEAPALEGREWQQELVSVPARSAISLPSQEGHGDPTTWLRPASLHLHFWPTAGRETCRDSMKSEPPSFKETQFLDKHARKNQRELPLTGSKRRPQIQAWGRRAPGSLGQPC